MSYIQNLVKEQVKIWFPNYKILENYRPKWMHKLEIDLFIPELNLAIEINGVQHYVNTKKFFKHKYLFELQQVRDFLKEFILSKNKVNFIKIKQGRNMISNLKKHLENTLNLKLKFDDSINKKAKAHWDENKDIFLEGASYPPYVKIIFTYEDKIKLNELFDKGDIKELFKFSKKKALILD